MSRVWTTGHSRDEVIDGSPARGHVAKFSTGPRSFRCVHPACNAKTDDCGLYCALHLWTFDNPVLRDASIFR